MTRHIKHGLFLILSMVLAGCSQEHADHSHSHDHNHNHTPHGGIVAPLLSGKNQAGFVELKLHDDKGDLELWLTKDEAGSLPLDLPLGTELTVRFPKLDAEPVSLRVRNHTKNEDENGMGNIRGEATNYFIFPGDTGTDATFLTGSDFTAEAVISFTAEGNTYATDPFELRPHHTH